MVLPLIIGGVILASSAIGTGTYFGLKNQAPDVIDNKKISYVTQNIDQTKSNEIIIGANSKVGTLNIKDSMSLSASPEIKQTGGVSTGGLNSNMILIAGATAGAIYLWRNK